MEIMVSMTPNVNMIRIAGKRKAHGKEKCHNNKSEIFTEDLLNLNGEFYSLFLYFNYILNRQII